jgi:hypothetical protein
MSARKRTTSAARLFDLHPIYGGIEAGAFARVRIAMDMVMDPRKREAQKATIQGMFRDGRELFGWIHRRLEERERSEVTLRALSTMIDHSNLSPEQKFKYLRAAVRRPRGRPSELKLLAVYALETKLARPEANWDQITKRLCPCPKQSHDCCCSNNLQSEVRRLKSLLRRTGLVRLIIAHAKHSALKQNLQEMLGPVAVGSR